MKVWHIIAGISAVGVGAMLIKRSDPQSAIGSARDAALGAFKPVTGGIAGAWNSLAAGASQDARNQVIALRQSPQVAQAQLARAAAVVQMQQPSAMRLLPTTQAAQAKWTEQASDWKADISALKAGGIF